MMKFPNLEIKRLQTAVHAAFRNWHTVGGTDEDLLAFLLIVQQEREKQPDQSASSLRLVANKFLQEAMTALEGENGEGMRLLRRRFLDNMQIREVAVELVMSEYTVSHKQREAIELIADLLSAWEKDAWQEKSRQILSRLPSPSAPKLFGVDEEMAALKAKMLQPGEPWLTAVVGIGGIGKTSLAVSVAREVAAAFHFENVVWVRLEPGGLRLSFGSPEQLRNSLVLAIDEQLWPEMASSSTLQERQARVRHALKQQRFLVVVDNIETAKDAAVMVECLNDWCDPSKFLLTSRVRPQGAFYLSLNELSRAAAAEMIRYYLGQQNVAAADSLTEVDVDAIYQHTGGNPLALKLVVSQLDSLSLPRVLHGLVAVNTDGVEEMYKLIYWQSWRTISEAARSLLEAMVMVAKDGADLDYLQEICGLEERPFLTAITELRQRSLLEVEGDLHRRRYRIHPLTKSFLQTEIIRWPFAPPMDDDSLTEE